MPISADVSELRAVGRSFDRAARSAPARAQARLARAGQQIRDTARATVRSQSYETGELYQSIEVRMNALAVAIVATADHAGFVEDGTSEMPAEPYLAPAFDQHVPGVLEGLADEAAQVWA